MKRITFLLLLLSLVSPIQAETLTEVIKHTLKTNPDVLISLNTRRTVDEELNQTFAGYLPTVELTGGIGKEISENSTTRIKYADGEADLTRRELGLSLSQMLFDGFNVAYGVEQQQFRVNSSAYRVKNTSENIALRATEVYLEILRRQHLQELARNNVVIHQKILEQIRLIVDSGAGRKADVQQSQSRLALAESVLVTSEGNVRDAEANYLRVTGKTAQNLVEPNHDSVASALPENLNNAIDTAIAQHAALKAVNAELAATEAQYKQTDSSFMPSLSLELGATDNNDVDGVTGKNSDMTAMLKMRYNLYRGGADAAHRREVAERVGAAKETINRTQRMIEEEVRIAWNELTTTRQRLKHLEQHTEFSNQVLDSYKEQFKLGQRSLLDVLDSENELFNARSASATANYIELLAMFRVLASTGTLLNTLNIAPPKEAAAQY